MTNRSRSSKRKPQQEPPSHTVNKKLRSKRPRRRRSQISPVLLASPRRKISGENIIVSVVSVDSSSGSDFAGGEASCNSSRASAVLAGKFRSSSRNGVSSENEGVRKGECVNFLRNRRFEKRNENEVEVSESSCVDSSSGVRERSRSLILKFSSGKENKNPKENDEVSEACTKSEITCAEQFSVENISKSSNGNLNISSEINRNDVVSVSSGVREASFEEQKSRAMENRASESEFSQGSRNHHANENCAELIAQSKTMQDSENSGVDSDLACTELLLFSYYDDESEYCSSQGTSFSDLHSEIFRECSELELSDYTPSLFVDSGSQFSEGSVGETPSPTYTLFLQYRNEFSMLASPINASSVEEEVSLHSNVNLFLLCFFSFMYICFDFLIRSSYFFMCLILVYKVRRFG